MKTRIAAGDSPADLVKSRYDSAFSFLSWPSVCKAIWREVECD